MSLATNELYEFSGFRLDVTERILWHRKKRIQLPPKAFDTLSELVRHHGRLLEKAELLERVWPGTFIEENNLDKNISLLRAVLGKRKGRKNFIETIRGKGYRFVAEVRVHPQPAAETADNLLPNFGRDHGDRSHLESDANKGAPGAGSRTMAESDTSRRYDIERQGNVFAVREWSEPRIDEGVRTESAGALDSRVPIRSDLVSRSTWGRLAALSVVLALVALVTAGSIFLWSTREERAGIPDRVYTYLTNGLEVQHPAISPDGKYFAYHDFDGQLSHLWLQQIGQSGRVELISPTKNQLHEKTFSPDGQLLYFLQSDDGQTSSLYKVAAFGSAPSKIIDNVASPASFSPDGERVAFVRVNSDHSVSTLNTARTDGTGQREILVRGGGELITYPTWSPDGRLIAFSYYEHSDRTGALRCRLSAVSPNGGDLIALTSEPWGQCHRAEWTSDGAGLVFVGTKIGDEMSIRRNQLWYLSLANGRTVRISNEWYWHELGGLTRDDAVLAVQFDRASHVWSMNANGDSRTAVQLTWGRADGRAGLAPLPDGRVGYVARNDDNLEIWTVSADGGERYQILNEPATVEELRASPDGNYFVFSAIITDRSELFRINVDGSQLTQLTFDGHYNIDSTISPDGWVAYSAITHDGRYSKTWLEKVPILGGPPARITDDDAGSLSPHYSPDGRLISYISANSRIKVIRAEGGPLLHSFDPVDVPRLNIGARWTPDGQSVAYIVHRKNVSNIWLQPINGDPPRSLTDFTSGSIYNFAYSHDGSRLYLARGYPVSDAVLIRNFAR